MSDVEVLRLAAAVESNSVHPVGKAIVNAAQAVNCHDAKVHVLFLDDFHLRFLSTFMICLQLRCYLFLKAMSMGCKLVVPFFSHYVILSKETES